MSATARHRTRHSRGLRLTRRGRAVVVAVVVALLLGAFWLGTRQVGLAATAGGDAQRPRAAVVPPDGTIWEIAVEADRGTDPRVTVRRIMEANGLSDPVVHPGQRLVLPEPR